MFEVIFFSLLTPCVNISTSDKRMHCVEIYDLLASAKMRKELIHTIISKISHLKLEHRRPLSFSNFTILTIHPNKENSRKIEFSKRLWCVSLRTSPRPTSLRLLTMCVAPSLIPIIIEIRSSDWTSSAWVVGLSRCTERSSRRHGRHRFLWRQRIILKSGVGGGGCGVRVAATRRTSAKQKSRKTFSGWHTKTKRCSIRRVSLPARRRRKLGAPAQLVTSMKNIPAWYNTV